MPLKKTSLLQHQSGVALLSGEILCGPDSFPFGQNTQPTLKPLGNAGFTLASRHESQTTFGVIDEDGCGSHTARIQPFDRVAPGRYRPGAPTDPYVRTLAHTVPQITVSLLGRKPNEQYARAPADNA